MKHPPTIEFRNTLTKKKEKFVPIEPGKVKMYSCGPTVYDFAHIGNFRSFLMSDLIFRVLKYAGFEVSKVQNITDVGHLTNDDAADATGEDKILKKARAENKDPFAIARFFEDEFVKDEKFLRIIPPNAGRPRATEFIAEQIEITKKLLENGFAYESDGSIFFRVSKFKKYGKLSGNSIEKLLAGARVEKNDAKENPLDFALWRGVPANYALKWNFSDGRFLTNADEFKPENLPGVPGWHIECSAMSRKLLGENFDIHTGGEDNIFPHHECEIAQNECGFGGKINYWIHAKHLLVDGAKMSKSKGNFFTIRDLRKKGISGAEIRFVLLSAHYRTPLNFTFESLEMARNSIGRITEFLRKFEGATPHPSGERKRGQSNEVANFKQKYRTALFDDLNVADALGAVFEMINFGHKNPNSTDKIVEFLKTDFDPIFDILPEKKEFSAAEILEIEAKISERKNARTEKNWAKSDEIRNFLTEKFKIELLDENGKTAWRAV